MKALWHIVRAVVPLGLLLGVPMALGGGFGRLMGGTDAVSGATVALDAPSGEYVVLINTSLHTDKAALECWEAFFETGDTEGIYNVFEDISCTVAQGDAGGLDMAKSFMSRLPENQMKVRTEDVTLMLSKAEHGRFDVIVMSKEMADSCNAQRITELTDSELINVREVMQ